MHIEFQPLRADHFEILWKWHNEAHVTENWNSFENFEAMKASYEKKIESNFVICFIIYLDGNPFGYIHAYKAWKVGDGWWPDEKEGTWGIDQFIGDPSFVGRGLGSKFIKEFIQFFLIKQGFQKLIVDPAPKNERAIRAYEKAGFRKVAVISSPDGPALLMELFPVVGTKLRYKII
jgi:RimJ/RimL family protein N-acetyltransferase